MYKSFSFCRYLTISSNLVAKLRTIIQMVVIQKDKHFLFWTELEPDSKRTLASCNVFAWMYGLF
jgi:hypothetical protein